MPKKNEPSEDLKILLKIANLVPKDATLLNNAKVFDEIYNQKPGIVRTEKLHPDAPFVQESFIETRLTLEKDIEKYPEFASYMRMIPDRSSRAWIYEYANVLRNRKMLRELLEQMYPEPGIAAGDVMYEIPAITRVVVGETFEFPKPLIETALKGVSSDRLRICLICEKIFWASRLDSYACSKKCNSVRRVRNLRKKKRERAEKLNNHFQPRNKNNGNL